MRGKSDRQVVLDPFCGQTCEKKSSLPHHKPNTSVADPSPARSIQFAALVAQQPANDLFRFSLAQALLAEGRPAEAIEHLVLCADKKPEWMLPRILLGKSLVGLGRQAEAKPWLLEALDLAVAQDHEDPAREVKGILAEL